MSDKIEIFRKYISQQGLKLTRQREIILDEFLRTAAHLSTEDLYLKVRKNILVSDMPLFIERLSCWLSAAWLKSAISVPGRLFTK